MRARSGDECRLARAALYERMLENLVPDLLGVVLNIYLKVDSSILVYLSFHLGLDGSIVCNNFLRSHGLSVEPR